MHTVSTADDVVATVQDLCAKVGKHAVSCGDRSGFIVNALLFPYLNDAVKMLQANYASADDIDTAMRTGCGLPMGPFEPARRWASTWRSPSSASSTSSSGSPASHPPRCSSTWSLPATSAARPPRFRTYADPSPSRMPPARHTRTAARGGGPVTDHRLSGV